MPQCSVTKPSISKAKGTSSRCVSGTRIRKSRIRRVWCTHGNQEHEEVYNPHVPRFPPRIWCNACWTVCAIQSNKKVKKGFHAKVSDAFNGTTRARPYIDQFGDTRAPRRSVSTAGSNQIPPPYRVSSPQQIPNVAMAGQPPRYPQMGPAAGASMGLGSSSQFSGMGTIAGQPNNQMPTGMSAPMQYHGMPSVPGPSGYQVSPGMSPVAGPPNNRISPISPISPGPSHMSGPHNNRVSPGLNPMPMMGMGMGTPSNRISPGPGPSPSPSMMGQPISRISPGLNLPSQFSGPGTSPMMGPPNNQMNPASAMGSANIQMSNGPPRYNTCNNNNNNGIQVAAYQQQHAVGPMQNHNLARYSEFEEGLGLK